MDVQYPIGKFDRTAPRKRAQWIADIAALPAQVEASLAALPPGGLDRPYREGGWTARQVVHHLADGHLSCVLRIRFALTEENFIVNPYDEQSWALLPDAANGPVEPSVELLRGLHARWAALLGALTEDQWQRTLTHPATGVWDLELLAGLYSWHGRHHVAHLGLIK
ncbi:MAG: putative metal-dependent hydrolase [Acidobacteria bacterium]|nr:putative metal-dependent hydrolase [Acidobacteriota bacterium]